MCEKYWELPNSRRCQEHRMGKPYGYDPEVEAVVAGALLPLIDAYGMGAIKTHVITELGIDEMDVV